MHLTKPFCIASKLAGQFFKRGCAAKNKKIAANGDVKCKHYEMSEL